MKLISPPSVADAAEIANMGAGSSLTIVPVAIAVAIVALVGLLSVTANVSSTSNMVSPVTLTVTT